MKKFVIGLVAVKLIFLVSLAVFLFSGYQNISVSFANKTENRTDGYSNER